MKRVRTGKLYRYDPVMLDVIRPTRKTSELNPGDVVRVINLVGAPPANTMGQCYVAHPDTGQFIGMVSVASLHPVSD